MVSETETVEMVSAVSTPEDPPEPLFRQSSIYALTLDEFQHVVCEPGKSFGSMNMDEFLNNIWTAEDNQTGSSNDNPGPGAEKPIARQPSLPRQGSLTLPTPLCRKTVEEVWSDIQRSNGSLANGGISGNAHRQTTFGEMTLEDFLIKAGVVREDCGPPADRNDNVVESDYGRGLSFGYAEQGNSGGAAGYQRFAQPAQVGGAGGGGMCYGGTQGLGCASPVSPVSSDGLRGGRKRAMNGPVEKVVERRQRRMIKNRESAARSRARKQAYTVELEALLNQLKEENAHLRKEMEDLEEKRRMKVQEAKKAREAAAMEAEKVKKRLRRVKSWPA